ncbi:hypothetical protein [Kribbella catacumbae]|uniref:hypothetical protein n=1 Tax=Kribbella catacumbae TaxID=460086 RepID=UPI0003708EE3|nr:hypothetical protein [Kribbella catacumbae]
MTLTISAFTTKRYRVNMPGDPYKTEFGTFVGRSAFGTVELSFDGEGANRFYDPADLSTGCGCSIDRHEDDCVRRPWSCPSCDQHYELRVTVLKRIYARVDPKFTILSVDGPGSEEPGLESTPVLVCDSCNHQFPIPDGVDVQGI